MAESSTPTVVYVTLAVLLLVLLSQSPRRSHLPSRRLKLRPDGPSDARHHITFDPLISEIELRREDREWDRTHFGFTRGATFPPSPEWEHLMDGEDYVNDAERFNLTMRLSLLFPKIDVAPADGFVTRQELAEWSFQQERNEQMHRAGREIKLHDKNRDGFLSFKEYEPPRWVHRSNGNTSIGDKFGWWKEDHFNVSDMDGDGLLNITEFNDFLNPSDTSNPKLIEWLCQQDIRGRDKDGDGKLNYQEYITGLFRLLRNLDDYNNPTRRRDTPDSTRQAKKLFARLDLDNDGYLQAKELKAIVHALHPSERFFAKLQADYVFARTDANKDGRLSLKEMIDTPHVFYNSVFSDDSDSDYSFHDEFR